MWTKEAPAPPPGAMLEGASEEEASLPPAASPTAIRHEGFGGYTYSFDPTTREITILEDPKGRVPSGYVVPKEMGPYKAILIELQKAGKAEVSGTVTPMDEEMRFTPADETAPPFVQVPPPSDPSSLQPEAAKLAGLGTSLGGEHMNTPYADRRLAGVPDPGDIDTPSADALMAGVPDPEAVATPYAEARMGGASNQEPGFLGRSLEEMEAMLGRLQNQISQRKKEARRSGAEATADPAMGGAQAQAPAGGGVIPPEGP